MSTTTVDQEELKARVAKFQAKRGTRDFVLTRDNRLYDAMDPESHAVIQIARSYASDMPGHWIVWNTNQEIVAEFITTRKTTHENAHPSK